MWTLHSPTMLSWQQQWWVSPALIMGRVKGWQLQWQLCTHCGAEGLSWVFGGCCARHGLSPLGWQAPVWSHIPGALLHPESGLQGSVSLGLPLPLLPSGSLSSSCGFPALETKMSWNVPPLRCSFSLCLLCAIWCFHLPGCACKAVCALAHLAYVA